MERDKARGVIIRSKVQWTEEGEKCTSYFLRLEKSNYNNKHITKLIDIDNNQITDPKTILEMEKNFYEKLYQAKSPPHDEYRESEASIFNELDLPQINENEKEKCDELLSDNELLKSIKAMKNGKSPGTEGLTSEFYKFFWIDLKNLLLDSLNYNLTTGLLSVEQRRGILTLIPKKDKNRMYLKNWRPLTLLNMDYKILAKTLANRLTKILPFLIDDDQTGYIQGRFIGCNIRLIEDILVYSTLKNISGILLTIDFEKAFDSLSWSFIEKSLLSYNFGEVFISYVKTMYNNITTTVINNGYISDWFFPQRGVRQGCPLSPYLFLISVEILACNIRQDRSIKGLVFNDTEIKISQLADDTTCVVKDEESLSNIIKTFKHFKTCAGLGINIDKTTARSLGSYIPSRENLFGLSWSQEPVFTLGVYISGDEDDHYLLNYKPKIIKMQQLLNSWKCRKLSLKGKITVINSLALSSLIYLASIIHVPDRAYKEIKNILTDFIWDGKPPKIAYDTLIQGIEKGGLKLTDFKNKVKSLTISWVKRLNSNDTAKWKTIPRLLYGTHDLNFYFSCNSAPLRETIKPKFYLDIQNTWSEMSELSEFSCNHSIVRNQVIWNNRYITIQNKPYMWKRWIDAGIINVKDILNNRGEFLDARAVSTKYGIRVNFLEVLQIRQSIPYAWRNALYSAEPSDMYNELHYIENDKRKILSKSDSKMIYWYFINKRPRTLNCIYKWQEKYPTLGDECWTRIFKNSFRITRETKLQSFQYKIIHRVIMCKKKLNEMRILDSPLCGYCQENDDLAHFFISCPYVKEFWVAIFEWISTVYETQLNIHDIEILFGIEGDDEYREALNFIILIGKYFIYRHRINDIHILNLYTFKADLRYRLKIQHAISMKVDQTQFKKFQPVYNAL